MEDLFISLPQSCYHLPKLLAMLGVYLSEQVRSQVFSAGQRLRTIPPLSPILSSQVFVSNL